MDKLNLPVEYNNFLELIPEEFLAGIGDIGEIANGIPGAGAIIGFGIRKYIQKREIDFLNDVINDLKRITRNDINKNLFLKRAYLTSQVIAKVQTQEKYNRFKKLLINSTLFEISDNDYELFNRLIDELTDLEFLYLSLLVKNIDRELNILNSDDDKRKLSAEYNKALEIITTNLKLNSERLNFLRSLAAGKGFINLQSAFGGLAFKNVSLITYDLVEFINKEGTVDE